MTTVMVRSGFIADVVNKDKFELFMLNARNYFIKGISLTDAELYRSYGFKNLNLVGSMFIPYSDNYDNYEESKFYSVETRLKTGIMFTYDSYQFSNKGSYIDLYKSIQLKGVLVDSLPSILKRCKEKYGNRWLDYFYEGAEELGYDFDEVQEFLDKDGIISSLHL